ncbi:pre-mRNA 3'-end-processing factor FIP1-like isoform X2 [Carassius carassius]|uniref:pre-mRNA 3'-end-processing factor FIP1-like isoform X2 n=1 Tax=Carassius carassius TaxID=217509 RepID=UPI0028685A1A|nr:pre-mRNA 3'-end-processing factor FIP1-like isoform X2 [Carassius carassius]
MSTREVTEKTADESADDETDWLYGDDNFEEEETTEKEVFSALIGDVDGESESDSDDDVCVTIGDIKTGGSQGSSFGSSSVSLNIKTSVSGSKSRGLDLDAEGNVLKVDVESFEEKPWRKPGAELSDYFNYGFNEDTWKAYCDKQRRLRMSLEILSLVSLSKIMVHQSSSNDLSEHSTRKSSGGINVIGGQAGTISRVEGRRRHSADENNIQVVSEQSSDTELSSPKLLPFFPPNIPPPPFPPPSISTTLPLIPPPGFPLPPGAPPPMIPPLDRLGSYRNWRERQRRCSRKTKQEHSRSLYRQKKEKKKDRERKGERKSSGRLGGYDRRSATPYPFPAGVYTPAVGVASWSGVIDSSKAWENYTRHNKERVREKARERGHTKDQEQERERYRETDREHSPSSQEHRSEEERVSRHRDHHHYGSERYRESSRREGVRDRHRERRHRDRNEQHRSSRSGSSRRRHDSDDADSHRRHRHKRSRHNRGSLEPSEECNVDQENQSEATE